MKQFIRSSMLKYSLQTLKALIIAQVLVGCTLPSTEKGKSGSQETGTFYVERTEGKFVSSENAEVFSIPVAKTASFQACLRDIQYKKEVSNHQFVVQGEGFAPVTVTSDASGCLTWEEKFNYDHLADADVLTIEKQIVAKGFQKGQRAVSFYVNPWQNKVISTLNTKIETALNTKDSSVKMKSTSEGKNLWMQDLRLNIEDRGTSAKGHSIIIDGRGEPSVLLTDADRQKINFPLAKGKFKMQLTLIASINENSAPKNVPLAKSEVIEIPNLNEGLLQFSIPMVLQSVCTRGQMQLGVRLDPVQGPAALKPFEGVFTLGPCDNLTGTFFARLKNDESSLKSNSLENYMSSSGSIDAGSAPISSLNNFEKSRVQVKELEVTPGRILNDGSALRKKVYNLRACLSNNLDGRAQRSQPVEVQSISGAKFSLRTSDSGCVQWDDTLDYNFFSQECMKTYSVSISSKELGINLAIPVEINPWSNLRFMARDVRWTDESKLKNINECAKEKARIKVISYNFKKEDIKYDINPGLELILKKQGVLTLPVNLVRPTISDTQDSVSFNLATGEYRIRYAIVDVSVTDYNQAQGLVYDVGEKIVKVDGAGTVIEHFEFKTKNIKALGNTQHLIMDIYPVESEAAQALQKQFFKGPIILGEDNESGSFVAENDENDLLGRLQKVYADSEQNHLQELQKMSTKENFAKQNSLTLLNLNREDESQSLRYAMENPRAWVAGYAQYGRPQPEMPLRTLQDFVERGTMDEPMAMALCRYWFGDRLSRPLPNKKFGLLYNNGAGAANLIQKCIRETKKSPRSYFDIENRFIVKNPVLQKSGSGRIQEFKISSGASVARSRSATDSYDYGIGMGVGSGFGIPGMSIFSAGVEAKYGFSHSDSESAQESNDISLATGKSLKIETINTQIKVDEYEKCTMVKLNPNLREQNKDFAGNLNDKIAPNEMQSALQQGLLLCAGESERKDLVFNENYYALNQLMPHGELVNTNVSDSRPFFLFIRGTGDYLALISRLNAGFTIPDSVKPDFKSFYTQDADPAEKVFTRGVRNFPGQWVAPQ